VGAYISQITSTGTPVCTLVSATTLGGGFLSSAVFLSQSASTVFGTAGVDVSSSAFTDVPGLTANLNVTSSGLVFISTDGGVGITCGTANCAAQVDVAVVVDGTPLPRGAFERLFVADNGAVVQEPTAYWSMSQAIPFATGSHQIKVQARLFSSTNTGGSATVSGGDGAVLQGALTVLILKR
jgi:hypothetical protein